jgi:cell pole-organizing protein PopZ
MSGSPPPKTDQPAADPSMEDILASIRRILSEEDGAKPAEDDVLQLDATMLVEDHQDAPPAAPEPAVEPVAMIQPEPPAAVVPDVAEATSESVGALLRRLVAERTAVVVHRGGPTIEDLVREEIRPLLQAWLDANLPALVERQVRVEIERVVGRALP